MTARPETDEQLQAFADEHLRYEIEMLYRVADRLRGRPPMKPDAVLTNALIESFAIHARNLLHFFWPVRPQGDDALAERFVDEYVGPSAPRGLDGIRERVNKEIAHLTYHRATISAEEKGWLVDRICVDLAPVIRALLDDARRGTLSDDFVRTASELTQLPMRTWRDDQRSPEG